MLWSEKRRFSRTCKLMSSVFVKPPYPFHRILAFGFSFWHDTNSSVINLLLPPLPPPFDLFHFFFTPLIPSSPCFLPFALIIIMFPCCVTGKLGECLTNDWLQLQRPTCWVGVQLCPWLAPTTLWSELQTNSRRGLGNNIWVPSIRRWMLNGFSPCRMYPY